MNCQRPVIKANTQRGAVLLLAMVFMLMMAVTAGTVMQTSILESYMAGNEQLREEAFQQAQAIVDEISADIDNFPVTGGLDYLVCPSVRECANNDTQCPDTSDCDARFAADPGSIAEIPPGVLKLFTVIRRGPLILESLPFRQTEDKVSGAENFDAAIFEARVELDGSDIRLGSANVIQGVAVRTVSSGQSRSISSG